MDRIEFCDKWCPMPSRIPDRTGELEVDCDCEESECPFKDVNFEKVVEYKSGEGHLEVDQTGIPPMRDISEIFPTKSEG